jgi:hypothetical protein
MAALHFCWLATYHAPAISTPDANSYFAQARLIAQEGTTSFALESPVQFIAPHWNKAADGRYYCTHPPGLGFILAIPYFILGYSAATWINPLFASLSLIIVFLLCRRLTGQYWAVLAGALVALNPFANEHALFGDSHIAVQLLLLLAVLCLLRMADKKTSIAWGAAAGLTAGIIPTLRYPEMLYLPALGLFMVLMVRRRRVTMRSALAFVAGTALPIALLLARNQIAYGRFWRTGYAATGEQNAFGVATLIQHAPTYLWKLLTEGAWLMFPLGIAGITAMIINRKSRSEGMLFAGLIVPVTLLYMAWYWRPDPQSMRFLIPTFPLYTIAGVWMLERLAPRPSAAIPLAIGILVATAAWGVPRGIMGMKHLERDDRVLADITAMLEEHVPEGSVLMAGIGVQQHLDFVGRWKLADAESLNPRPRELGGEKGPGALESERSRSRESPAEPHRHAFIEAARKWAGDSGRVFLLAKPAEAERWKRFVPTGFHLEQLDSVKLPVGRTPMRRRPGETKRSDALPEPAPNSIFDLALDGQALGLFELER